MSKFIIKNKKIIIVAAVLVFLTFFSIFFLTSQTKSKKISSMSNPNPVGLNSGVKTVLEINNVRYEDEITGEMSVYDFMSKLQSERKITFKDKTYVGMGKLIEEINGLKSSGNKYWIYYVNDKEAQVGVLDYKIKQGDIVSWKYGSF